MKRLSLLALLIGLLSLAGTRPLQAQPPDPPVRLRVLQWNVGTLNPWALRLPDDALPRLVETIVDAAPDVVTLQEVSSLAQVQRVQGDLAARGLAFEAHVVIVDLDHPDGLAVLLSRVPAPATRKVLRTSTGFSCQALDLGPVSVVVVHGPVSSPAARARFFDEVLAWTRAELPGPCVLSGDFNVSPSGGAGLAAVLPWLQRPDRATYRRLTAALPAHTRAGPTTAYRLHLDHVMGREVTLRSEQVLRGRRRFPQDHDPVLVELEVVPARSASPGLAGAVTGAGAP